MVPAVCFDIAGERRKERAILRGYPVQDCAFYTFGVIRPRVGDTFLNLLDMMNLSDNQ